MSVPRVEHTEWNDIPATLQGNLPAWPNVLSEAFADQHIVPYFDTMDLSRRHRRTLRAIYENPLRSDVAWMDIEKLLRSLGAELSEGRGSRVRIYLNGVRAVFLRPHPQKETNKGALRSMRRFLLEAGIDPEDRRHAEV